MSAVGASGPCRRDAGFMLVGVAMFILVLTILGLSLFSLSGFESQFYIQSLRRSEAFNAAAGGIERARFALINGNGRLDAVQTNLPADVDSTIAVQGDLGSGPSTGPINWSGADIWIRVRAHKNDATSVLLARFSPGQVDDYYKRLLTVRSFHVDNVPGVPWWGNVKLNGEIALPSGVDMSWNAPPPPGIRPPIDVRNFIPYPTLPTYFATHLATAAKAVEPGNSGNYTLDAVANDPVNRTFFFYSDRDPGQWNIDESVPNPTITVRGTAIWLINQGMRFQHRVTIQAGTPDAKLIIVMRDQNDIPETDLIQFEEGISDGALNGPYPASGVPLLLVTDGIVAIEAGVNHDIPSVVTYMSVFAGRFQLADLRTGFGETQLWHPPSMLTPVTDPLMDALYTLRVLPNTSVGGSRLSLDAGTWQDLSAAY